MLFRFFKENTTKLFAIADLHLAMDPSISDKSMDMFGGSWVNHANRLREIWLRLVDSDDVVFIPGDISWALRLDEAKADLAWIDALPGRKVLLRGNHDLWWTSMKKMRGLFPTVDFIQNDCLEFEDFVLCGSRGWLCPEDINFSEAEDRKIYERELLRLAMSLKCAKKTGKEIIAATHYPPIVSGEKTSGFMELYKEYEVETAVFGHLHGDKAFSSAPEGTIDGVNLRLVSLDRLSAAPLLIREY